MNPLQITVSADDPTRRGDMNWKAHDVADTAVRTYF